MNCNENTDNCVLLPYMVRLDGDRYAILVCEAYNS